MKLELDDKTLDKVVKARIAELEKDKVKLERKVRTLENKVTELQGKLNCTLSKENIAELQLVSERLVSLLQKTDLIYYPSQDC